MWKPGRWFLRPVVSMGSFLRIPTLLHRSGANSRSGRWRSYSELKLVAFLKEVVNPRKTRGSRAILTAAERDAARRKRNKITKHRTR